MLCSCSCVQWRKFSDIQTTTSLSKVQTFLNWLLSLTHSLTDSFKLKLNTPRVKMNKLRQCLFIFREHSASSLKLIMKTNILVSTTKPLFYVLLLYNSDNNFKYVRTKYLQLIPTEAIKKVEFKVFFWPRCNSCHAIIKTGNTKFYGLLAQLTYFVWKPF